MEELKERRNVLSGGIEAARKRQGELSEMRSKHIRMDELLTDVEKFAGGLREGIDKLTFEERQRLVRLLIERVVVKGNEVMIEHVVPLTGRFSALHLDHQEEEASCKMVPLLFIEAEDKVEGA